VQHSILSPNRALKKIIQDLIAEGGVGLYTVDASAGKAAPGEARKRGVDENGSNVPRADCGGKQPAPAKVRVVDMFREHVLSLKCLGPPEVDWFQKSFSVTPRGCAGGRNNYGRNLPKHDIHANALNASSAAGPGSGSGGADGSARGVFLAEDMLVFKDNNISRQHFEMSLVKPGVYAIRDLGSVGGTYLRVPFATHSAEVTLPLNSSASIDAKGVDTGADTGSERDVFPALFGSAADEPSERVAGAELVYLDSLQQLAQPQAQSVLVSDAGASSGRGRVLRSGQRLWPFTIFLLGKHQFIVEKIDDRNTAAGNKIYTKAADGAEASRAGGENEQIARVVAEAEAVLAQIRQLSLGGEKENDSQQDEDGSSSNSTNKKVVAAPGADTETLISLQRRLDALAEQLDNWGAPAAMGPAADSKHSGDIASDSCFSLPTKLKNRRCVITCVGPDGSPSVGKSYVVGAGGAVIGRNIAPAAVVWRDGDDISAAQSAYMDAKHADSPQKLPSSSRVGGPLGADLARAVPVPTCISVVDNALSSEHARIIMDPLTGHFHLCDGSFRVTAQASAAFSAGIPGILVSYEPLRGSTNGSWVRLSAASKMSPWFAMRAGMEVSISQVRFAISQGEDTVHERDVQEDEWSRGSAI